MHPFLPAHAAESLVAVDLQDLWTRGKRLILLDVDHTIVRWKSEDIEEPVLQWIERAKSLGFEICILSNTRHPERLERISKRLGIVTVRGRFKPSRAMFRLACLKFKRSPQEAIMIGDQLMTDVLGANRSGIDAIWVRRMDSREFAGTKINRAIERMLTGAIYRALVIPEDHGPADPARPTTTDTTIVKQITRFVVVGGSAFAIDSSLQYVFLRFVHLGGRPLGQVVGTWALHAFPQLFRGKDAMSAGAPFIGIPVSVLAMLYTYVLNRQWTFEAVGKADKHVQMRRFFLVTFLGLAFQNGLLSLFWNGQPATFLPCKVAATFFQAIWNFVGQRLYAFQDRRK